MQIGLHLPKHHTPISCLCLLSAIFRGPNSREWKKMEAPTNFFIFWNTVHQLSLDHNKFIYNITVGRSGAILSNWISCNKPKKYKCDLSVVYKRHEFAIKLFEVVCSGLLHILVVFDGPRSLTCEFNTIVF